jgi:hypothetical protein
MTCTYIHRLQGLEYEVLQWCICRLEAWFATDMDNISLKTWDQVCNAKQNLQILTCTYRMCFILCQNHAKDEFICQNQSCISKHTLA